MTTVSDVAEEELDHEQEVAYRYMRLTLAVMLRENLSGKKNQQTTAAEAKAVVNRWHAKMRERYDSDPQRFWFLELEIGG